MNDLLMTSEKPSGCWFAPLRCGKDLSRFKEGKTYVRKTAKPWNNR